MSNPELSKTEDSPPSEFATGIEEDEYDEDIIIEEYINERKLRDATGEEDLTKVKYLEIVVNTTKCSLGSLGSKLPSLSQLKLNGSKIESIRDIGTSLVHTLQVLWISRSSLREFDGIEIFSNLRELYASYNQISDLFPITFLSSLEVLDLEGNSIDNFNQIYNLRDLENLYSLNLSNNPIFLNDKNNYLSKIKEILELEKKPSFILDDFDISDVQNQAKKPLVSKKKAREFKIRQKMIENEISFMKNSIRFTKIDAENVSELENSPKIVCKAPKYMTFEDKEIYVRRMEKRPMTARGRFSHHSSSKLFGGRGKDKRRVGTGHRDGQNLGRAGSLGRPTRKKKKERKKYSCSSFNMRPMSARPSTEYVFDDDDLFSKFLLKNSKKNQKNDKYNNNRNNNEETEFNELDLDQLDLNALPKDPKDEISDFRDFSNVMKEKVPEDSEVEPQIEEESEEQEEEGEGEILLPFDLNDDDILKLVLKQKFESLRNKDLQKIKKQSALIIKKKKVFKIDESDLHSGPSLNQNVSFGKSSPLNSDPQKVNVFSRRKKKKKKRRKSRERNGEKESVIENEERKKKKKLKKLKPLKKKNKIVNTGGKINKSLKPIRRNNKFLKLKENMSNVLNQSM